MIREYAEALCGLTDADWCRYAFGREPLAGKLTAGERYAYYRGAVDCGAENAREMRARYGDAPLAEYAEREGLKLILNEQVSDGVFTTFATFGAPDEITIYADNARATDALIEREGLAAHTGGVKTFDLLLAHELFHSVENRRPDLYTKQKHLVLFRIGRFENRSKILCLGEIAAMGFARELTGLPCSPYVFDVLMLYAKNPQRARQHYEMVMKLCGEAEEE